MKTTDLLVIAAVAALAYHLGRNAAATTAPSTPRPSALPASTPRPITPLTTTPGRGVGMLVI